MYAGSPRLGSETGYLVCSTGNERLETQLSFFQDKLLSGAKDQSGLEEGHPQEVGIPNVSMGSVRGGRMG